MPRTPHPVPRLRRATFRRKRSPTIPWIAAPTSDIPLAITSGQFIGQQPAAILLRRGRDAAGRYWPPTAWPDAAGAWRGSPADTVAALRAAGTGSRVAAAAPQASPPTR